MKLKTILMFGAGMMLTLGACSQTEKTEAVVADVEAAQIEGRNAAREFVSREWTDTMELQKHLLDAKAQQSKYLINKNPEAAAAYDSAFVSTIRSVRPDIAAQLQ